MRKIAKEFTIVLSIILVVLLAGFSPVILAEDPGDEVVTFPDPNLEAVIRQAINKPTGDVCKADLATITNFNAYNKDIFDLGGLENCINLQYLQIQSNRVTNLQPLTNLINLRGLLLSHIEVSDLTPLSNLINLKDLEVVPEIWTGC